MRRLAAVIWPRIAAGERLCWQAKQEADWGEEMALLGVTAGCPLQDGP